MTAQELTLSLEAAEYSIRFCDSYTRMPAVLDLACQMEESEWFRLLGQEWSGCDNVSQHLAALSQTPMRLRNGLIAEMMTEAAMDYYDQLPDEIVVYRGCYNTNKWGLSWSIERYVAETFPFRQRYIQDGQPLLVKALIEKRKITAVMLDRDEYELILWRRPIHISTSYLRSDLPLAELKH